MKDTKLVVYQGSILLVYYETANYSKGLVLTPSDTYLQFRRTELHNSLIKPYDKKLFLSSVGCDTYPLIKRDQNGNYILFVSEWHGINLNVMSRYQSNDTGHFTSVDHPIVLCNSGHRYVNPHGEMPLGDNMTIDATTGSTTIEYQYDRWESV